MSYGKTWPGAQELQVQDTNGETIKALAYPQLIGPINIGTTVALNTSALDRGLGTGGYALVAAIIPTEPPTHNPTTQPGHLVKARYTPTQAMVLGVDEQESKFHTLLKNADNLDHMPVITADLHSALPAIIAGIHTGARTHNLKPIRIAYIMTDGGALPAWFSRTAATLRSNQTIESIITVGQAYGGDHEAVTVHTGLLAARHVVKADITIVIQGPGNLGTGTTWGFSGVAVGETMNAAAILNGTPIGSLRISGGDLRDRHIGISHHSLTALGKVARMPGHIVTPHINPNDTFYNTFPHIEGTPTLNELSARIESQIADLQESAPWHTYVQEPLTQELHAELEASPVRLSTMGRGYRQDPLAFLTAAAAGAYATKFL